MDMTEVTTAIDSVGTDVGTAAAAVISVVLVYAGFKWVRRALW